MKNENKFITEIKEFIRFLKNYCKERVINFGVRFEKTKDVVVAFLIVKRGKYSQSFLNSSFFLLVFAAIVAGPIIAENNPFIARYLSQNQTTQDSVLSADVNEIPADTNISIKPPDRVRDYKVASGDTLASIAKKFDISVDTIKWANNIKGQTIKPSQILKIPPVTGVVHIVASGDTVYSIAKKYKTDAQNIVNFPFNDYEDPETFSITPGQTIIVPDGVVEEAKPVYKRYIAGSQIAQGQQGTGSFIWPTTGEITQYPVWYHMAVDIANRSAPPVYAADTGTVTFASCVRGSYGCHIIIDHANGYQTLYGHLSQIGVNVGQGVARGAQIGVMGSTGRSTGTHLHFEVRSGGHQLNPLNFLK